MRQSIREERLISAYKRHAEHWIALRDAHKAGLPTPPMAEQVRLDVEEELDGVTRVVYPALQCACCEKILTSKPLLDHNHITGIERGWVCARCNSLIRDMQEHILRYLVRTDAHARKMITWAAQELIPKEVE